VLRLLAEVQGKRVEVDACVTAKIDVTLKNVPASVVESALLHKLGLTREPTPIPSESVTRPATIKWTLFMDDFLWRRARIRQAHATR